ncbi:hypothetical protein ANASTE_01647 [Anaerofustis stercorihominis DSM 17244]|uniref:Uncharacterized protein n=1 Tax=Anaerofustis stercorihominis DSM 17244 TaxID=445971 RepID=B1C8N4_9FIRM|nr:hypothetical protein ANASTE_01647 [Anaerofustis stercorihominis DSM 17244]
MVKDFFNVLPSVTIIFFVFILFILKFTKKLFFLIYNNNSIKNVKKEAFHELFTKN